MDFHIYSPLNMKKTARLPRKSDAQGQREVERMVCAVCLDWGARRDVVLQAWLGEESDVGREVVLQTKTRTDRPLPRGADGGLFGSLQRTMQVVTCVER